MSTLSTFHPQSRVVVIGASGGIGRALTDMLATDPRVASLHAFSRIPQTGSPDRVKAGQMDITDESSIAAAAEVAAASGPVDLLIVASGILHREPDIQPEKSLRELDPGALMTAFSINAVGPAMIAKHFLQHMRRDHKTVFAALSARVGSISDNRLGGWASYRASKAALNMLLKTISIEQARRSPRSVIAGLHPGTVATNLSSPFTSRVPEGQLFTPGKSAEHLLRVINTLEPADSGGLFAWDGKRIEF
jgi:NAD(P)-dependent dehydrogenase (short-subunit alcohol dehydrogenase family)